MGIHLYELSDIESLEVHDGGGDLSAGATGSSIYVVKPREWAVIRDALNSNYYSDPTYYTLLNRASTATVAAYDIWMASPPATAGTNSIRIVHYGIEAWNTTRDAPNFGTEFDTVFTLKIAHNLRLMKDLEVNDLLVKMAPFEQRLYQATWEPKPEDDFQIACTGRSKTRTKYSTRTGWIRRY